MFELRVLVAGLTLTEIDGASVMVADERAVPSTWLLAVAVTVCAALMVAGAV